jgi:hypothetical protein
VVSTGFGASVGVVATGFSTGGSGAGSGCFSGTGAISTVTLRERRFEIDWPIQTKKLAIELKTFEAMALIFAISWPIRVVGAAGAGAGTSLLFAITLFAMITSLC